MLKDLLVQAFPDQSYPGVPAIFIEGIESDSRKVKKGYLFIAINGTKEKGFDFVPQAIENGAVAVLSEEKAVSNLPVFHFSVSDAREALAKLACAFYNFPSRELKMIGVTGTNGKTTCAYLLEHLLTKHGVPSGVLGTINYRYAGIEIPALHTTPDPVQIQSLLAKMREKKCKAVAMEVSSHALDQKRTAGIEFDSALFTNLTQDHLDYHKTMDDYFNSKAKLFFELASNKTAILNADDLWINRLRGKLKCRTLWYGIKNKADLKAVDICAEFGKTHFNLIFDDRAKLPVILPLVGTHNVYNALGALGVLHALGFDLKASADFLADFKGVPGRLERVDCGQDFQVFVDFAHTPDGLQNVLTSLKPYQKRKLIVVFGCGGDRDITKRPKMGRIAAELSDFVVITSDNPRSEDPKAICEAVKAGLPEGFKNFVIVPDRKKAIRQALLSARKDDIVVLAGKGHERSQIIGTQAISFSDQDEARNVLSGN